VTRVRLFPPCVHNAHRPSICVLVADAIRKLSAFDFVAKKSGHSVDRNTSEKITDGARGLFEKATG
jgi:hypothetical protein